MQRVSSATPTGQRILDALFVGDFVEPDVLACYFQKNSMYRRTLNHLIEIGVVEQRMHTLSDERGPGWCWDLRQRLGLDDRNPETWNYLLAYRLKNPYREKGA